VIIKTLAAMFVGAVLLNYPWELAQTPFYAGMENLRAVLWHCFTASLGDGILVLLVFGAAAAAQHSLYWFKRPTRAAVIVMGATGIVLALSVEWWALRTGRWQYSDRMPLIPGTGIGLVPLLQMLVLPPAIFWLARRLHRK
jgi:hypothetical protein